MRFLDATALWLYRRLLAYVTRRGLIPAPQSAVIRGVVLPPTDRPPLVIHQDYPVPPAPAPEVLAAHPEPSPLIVNGSVATWAAPKGKRYRILHQGQPEYDGYDSDRAYATWVAMEADHVGYPGEIEWIEDGRTRQKLTPPAPVTP